MESSDVVAATTHVLILPFPLPGHMTPLLDLAHDIAVRGLDVTVVVFPTLEHLLLPLLSRSPTIQKLVLPLPPDASNMKINSFTTLFLKMQALRSLHDPLLRWARSHQNPPVAIISDFFLGWTEHLAADLGIARVNFSPSSSLMISLNHCVWKELPEKTSDDMKINFSSIPNSPTYPWRHICPFYWACKEAEPEMEFVKEGFVANMASWGHVFNTFSFLEEQYLDHMRKDVGHHRIWAVGPLGMAISNPNDMIGRGGASSVPVGDIMSWLDTCPEGSVIYVCFGSGIRLNPDQIDAVAAALENSGARFVWVTKEDEAAKSGTVLEGFEKRTEGKGMVIRGWAPQVAILGHSSVATFLTHCGWNSVLEGIIAGAKLLTWPMMADQFVNARLMAEIGVGVKVTDEGLSAVPDPNELARLIEKSTSTGLQNKKVMELKKKAMDSVAVGGTSSSDMEKLVDELHKLKSKDSTY